MIIWKSAKLSFFGKQLSAPKLNFSEYLDASEKSRKIQFPQIVTPIVLCVYEPADSFHVRQVKKKILVFIRVFCCGVLPPNCLACWATIAVDSIKSSHEKKQQHYILNNHGKCIRIFLFWFEFFFYLFLCRVCSYYQLLQ